jgi:diguanylate cyclase (GGDEF)-like protein
MPETGSDRAALAAERFRERVGRAFEGRPVELSISFGVASYPADARSWEELLDAADKALYQAKDAGRDRVVVFKGETTPTIAPTPA